MFQETITFHDLDGNEVSDTFYFGLSKSELVEMTLSVKGGYEEYLKAIARAQNGDQIMATFKDLIAKSVGYRSDDGRSFLKSPEYTQAFMQSDAFEEMFIRLISDAEYGAKFAAGVVPKDLERFVEMAKVEDAKPREYTEKELLAMSQDEFDRIVGTDTRRMSRDHLLIATRRRTSQPA